MATTDTTFTLNNKEYPAIFATLFADTKDEMETYVSVSSFNEAIANAFESGDTEMVERAANMDNHIVFFIDDELMETMSKEEIVNYVENQLQY